MFILGQAPKRIGVRQIFFAIESGRKNRQRLKLSDPYAKYKDKKERKRAMLADAKIIADSYNTKAKDSTYEQRKSFYKEILQIELGHDPLPKVGDYYQDHTVTEIVHTDKRFELYGVLGKMSKRELNKIVEESQKPECLRDKMKRRGYRFAIVEVL